MEEVESLERDVHKERQRNMRLCQQLETTKATLSSPQTVPTESNTPVVACNHIVLLKGLHHDVTKLGPLSSEVCGTGEQLQRLVVTVTELLHMDDLPRTSPAPASTTSEAKPVVACPEDHEKSNTNVVDQTDRPGPEAAVEHAEQDNLPASPSVMKSDDDQVTETEARPSVTVKSRVQVLLELRRRLEELLTAASRLTSLHEGMRNSVTGLSQNLDPLNVLLAAESQQQLEPSLGIEPRLDSNEELLKLRNENTRLQHSLQNRSEEQDCLILTLRGNLELAASEMAKLLKQNKTYPTQINALTIQVKELKNQL